MQSIRGHPTGLLMQSVRLGRKLLCSTPARTTLRLKQRLPLQGHLVTVSYPTPRRTLLSMFNLPEKYFFKSTLTSANTQMDGQLSTLQLATYEAQMDGGLVVPIRALLGVAIDISRVVSTSIQVDITIDTLINISLDGVTDGLGDVLKGTALGVIF